jgi:hypothetical protein
MRPKCQYITLNPCKTLNFSETGTAGIHKKSIDFFLLLRQNYVIDIYVRSFL